LVVDGRLVVRPALSETEAVDMPEVGTLEAFNTDGLRSLCDTLAVPNMRERTMRYPGHAELMRVFRETGLFSEESLTVGDATIRPIDLTSKLLLGHWAYEPGEEDLTVMRVQAEGLLGDDLVCLQWDLYDEYDPQKDQTSMGRTTAFPATSFARQILQGHRKVPGVHPPEAFGGDPAIVNRVLDDLAKRGVHFHRSCEPIR
jgi:saccharopine dehydrogenase-like NADP-dependent oxidoreductase